MLRSFYSPSPTAYKASGKDPYGMKLRQQDPFKGKTPKKQFRNTRAMIKQPWDANDKFINIEEAGAMLPVTGEFK